MEKLKKLDRWVSMSMCVTVTVLFDVGLEVVDINLILCPFEYCCTSGQKLGSVYSLLDQVGVYSLTYDCAESVRLR
jgi:hypothetical protein